MVQADREGPSSVKRCAQTFPCTRQAGHGRPREQTLPPAPVPGKTESAMRVSRRVEARLLLSFLGDSRIVKSRGGASQI